MLAGSDFSHPGPWGPLLLDEAQFGSNIGFFQQHYDSFERLENAECIQAYRGDVSAWSNVVMIANSNSSVVYDVFEAAPFNISQCPWQCCGNIGQPLDQPSCNIDILLRDASE